MNSGIREPGNDSSKRFCLLIRRRSWRGLINHCLSGLRPQFLACTRRVTVAVLGIMPVRNRTMCSRPQEQPEQARVKTSRFVSGLLCPLGFHGRQRTPHDYVYCGHVKYRHVSACPSIGTAKLYIRLMIVAVFFRGMFLTDTHSHRSQCAVCSL